jgi:hypothetical protein
VEHGAHFLILYYPLSELTAAGVDFESNPQEERKRERAKRKRATAHKVSLPPLPSIM